MAVYIPIARPAEQEAGSLDCSALIENSRKAEASTLAMLLIVQKQQKETEARGEAFGADMIDEVLKLLAGQERQLTQALRELEALQCASSSPLPITPQ
jgi:hypothetical protein